MATQEQGSPKAQACWLQNDEGVSGLDIPANHHGRVPPGQQAGVCHPIQEAGMLSQLLDVNLSSTQVLGSSVCWQHPSSPTLSCHCHLLQTQSPSVLAPGSDVHGAVGTTRRDPSEGTVVTDWASIQHPCLVAYSCSVSLLDPQTCPQHEVTHPRAQCHDFLFFLWCVRLTSGDPSEHM